MTIDFEKKMPGVKVEGTITVNPFLNLVTLGWAKRVARRRLEAEGAKVVNET